MPYNVHITEHERHRIVFLKEQGYNVSEIAAELGVSDLPLGLNITCDHISCQKFKPLPKCHGETGGIDVTVCDDYKIPAVKFTESSTVVVRRTGKLDSFIVVRITLHCLSPQDKTN